ncbi:peptidylprolyl isomerase [bacterium]|nr:MAG: peptidylprolyl isomerase [bacterium]
MRRLLPLLLLLPAAAQAQVEPSKLYQGVDRDFEVRVRIPRDGKAALVWGRPDGSKISEITVKAGKVELSRAFPEFWNTVPKTVTYVQLRVDGKGVGAPLVLQPMNNPVISKLAADGKTVEFVPDEDQAFAGYRVYVAKNLLLETSFGKMEFRLRPDCAPNTAFNIMQFVEGGLYDETIWHRVVAKRPDGTAFVIQGGDPAGSGSGGPGFAYALEKSPLEHKFGTVSIARSTDPNTNGCQLFVCLSRAGTKHLDGRYASFGEMIQGKEAVLKTAAVPVGKDDRPNDPPKILRAKLVLAAPWGEEKAPLGEP